MLQSKMGSGVDFPEESFPERVLLKSVTMDTMLKLTQKDWIKEQMEDVDINKVVHLLKSNKLSTYKAREIDSLAVRVLLKYRKDLILKNGLLYRKTNLKNHLEMVVQFVLPKQFIHKAILACHDDNGHLGMELTLGFYRKDFSGPKWQRMCKDISVLVRDV